MARAGKCAACAAPLPRRRRAYCSAPCARVAHNERRRNSTPRRRKCLACLAWYEPTRKGQRFCSGACRQVAFRKRREELRLLRADPAYSVPDVLGSFLAYIEVPCASRDERVRRSRAARKAAETRRRKASTLMMWEQVEGMGFDVGAAPAGK